MFLQINVFSRNKWLRKWAESGKMNIAGFVPFMGFDDNNKKNIEYCQYYP